MPLEKAADWLKCLREGRQRLGLTPTKVATLLAKGNETGISGWLNIANTDLIKGLTKELNQKPEEVIFKYICAVANRLPDGDRTVINCSLNLDQKEEYATLQLGDRQDIMKRLRQSSSTPTYRSNIEDPILRTFAKALDDPTEADLLILGLPQDSIRNFIKSKNNIRNKSAGRAVVVGAAVMDLNFVIPHMPDSGESVQALRFAASPGGKGLCQAVACARLGMETSLISVIGDDHYGREILEYLEREHVSTDLIVKTVGAQSAVTGVFTKHLTGASMAIGWKNSHQLHFAADMLDTRKFRDEIVESEFLLCSFELPEPVVSKAIKLAHENGAITIVTPAPPFLDVVIDPKVRPCIDFMVANVWELKYMTKQNALAELEGGEVKSIGAIASDLLVGDQIRNVVVTNKNDCHAFLTTPNADGIHPLTITGYGNISDSAGERDAFCAMLARRLHGSKRELSAAIDAVEWATAAMGCVRGGTSVPDTMPNYDRVDELMRKRTPKDLGGGTLIIKDGETS